MSLPILIAGAGPGGLSAALALKAAGHPVLVLEQAPELRTAGAGLIVAVNAMRLFDSIDLAQSVQARGAELLQGTVQSLARGPLSDLSL